MGDLDSFLIEITANVFTGQGGAKGDRSLDTQSAIEQAVVVSTINAAVEARVLSAIKDQRVKASEQLPAPPKFNYTGDRQALIDAVRGRPLRVKNHFLRSRIHLVRRCQ